MRACNPLTSPAVTLLVACAIGAQLGCDRGAAQAPVAATGASRTGPRHQDAQRRTVRRLGSGLLAHGRRDGYPKRIWDKRTGVIDKDVAAYWREHYHLVHIMKRDWATLGPNFREKLEIYAGAHDNIYLTNAVYYADDFLTKAKNPPADAKIVYGIKNEHCFSDDTTASNAFSRLTYHSRFIRKMATHWLETAPAGADTRSWRY